MIQNLYNPQGFYWWIGVCENRNDPIKAGRCQVRIFGDHSADKIELPTADLPWAIPMMPITSASISGKGQAPLGPVDGTWVVGWYLDGPDKQQPMMIGTVGSSVVQNTFSEVPERKEVNNPVEESTQQNGRKPVEGWELGKTSEKYESGGKGPGVINDYNKGASGDYGGASYGCYQLASYLPPVMPSGKARPSATNSPLVQFIRQSRFKNQLLGLKPATPEFDAAWKKIAQDYPDEFKEDQHAYIKKAYYDVMMSNIKRAGIDLSNYGPAVQDLVWSTAVQLGPGKYEVFVTPLKNKPNLTEADIVNLVSEYKKSTVGTTFRSSTQAIKDSVKNRFASEQQTLLTMIT